MGKAIEMRLSCAIFLVIVQPLFLTASEFVDSQPRSGGSVYGRNSSSMCENVRAAGKGSKALKTVFPTGVFWAWERTKPNAELAKKELWTFAEENLKLLHENGYDTCWFVNFSPKMEDQLKMLSLAEKYGMKVLFNADLLTAFYEGIRSLDHIDQLARRTAARLGHHNALLGYVLKDEPVMADLETCNYFYDRMKAADPLRDSVVVAMNRHSLSYLRDSKLPVICSDIYYFSHDHSTQLPSPRPVSQAEFTNALKSYGNAAELYGKHSWFMGQMFGDVWGRHWFNGKKMVVYPGSYLHWRMPTEAESRWQVWEALRLGTKGVFFYVLHPPIPLFVPPEKVTDPKLKKRIARMDKAAATAASWKPKQKLTDKMLEIDPGEGMLQPGGKPTPQMLASASVMKLIRANEQLLLNRRKADFPVFFPGDGETDTSTFVSGNRWIGVIVNRNLDSRRTIEVLLPPNVSGVTVLNTGKKLELKTSDRHFRKIVLTLPAGDGVLLEADFNHKPGMRVCFESFDQQKNHRVAINDNAGIFHHGNFGADENRSLGLKKTGDGTKPVCVLRGLSFPGNPGRTFSKNLSRSRNGVTYCLLRGRLKNAKVKSDVAGQLAAGENFMHLKNVQEAKVDAGKGQIIREKDLFQPFVVPKDASALEFYLGQGDYIEEIVVWYVPGI